MKTIEIAEPLSLTPSLSFEPCNNKTVLGDSRDRPEFLSSSGQLGKITAINSQRIKQALSEMSASGAKKFLKKILCRLRLFSTKLKSNIRKVYKSKRKIFRKKE